MPRAVLGVGLGVGLVVGVAVGLGVGLFVGRAVAAGERLGVAVIDGVLAAGLDGVGAVVGAAGAAGWLAAPAWVDAEAAQPWASTLTATRLAAASRRPDGFTWPAYENRVSAALVLRRRGDPRTLEGEPQRGGEGSVVTTDQSIAGLRRYNLLAAALHAVQAFVVLALANGFTLPVTAHYLAGPPGTMPSDAVTLLDTPVGLAVAGFFALSAVAHLVLASPQFFDRYRAGLLTHRNYFRWVEYSLSSSLMIVLIAQLVGISDVAALVALFGVNVSMILFGWLQEKYQEPGDGGWLPFIFGCIAGIVPWLAVVVYTIAPGSTSGATPPAFVYAIIVSLFLFFNVFALNQWLQYKQVGRWRDYLVGERAYITLSLVAKSALAWQIFAGTLAG